VHWNTEEAAERAARLARAGHKVAVLDAPQSPAGYKRAFATAPEAVLIDLARLPSHGRELGGWLRRTKATRALPLVFIAGDPEKTERTRALMPDAVFTDWAHVRGAITRALRAAPAAPVVPGAMAGYSGTPLPKKLGVKPGDHVLILGAPADFAATLGELPAGAVCAQRGEARITLLFARSAAELAKRWPAATRAVSEGGRLWICWPKAASGLQTDLNETGVRAFGMARGWVDFKIAAVDATWSGLAFARREAGRR